MERGRKGKVGEKKSKDKDDRRGAGDSPAT